MKVVLLCGGLGTRIREYSENIPKPMVPVGPQPILWHVMQYSGLCPLSRFKATAIKDCFLNYRASASSDCVISEFGSKVEIPGAPGLACDVG